jgi:cbb3-type cytochrome oxidase subunit 3
MNMDNEEGISTSIDSPQKPKANESPDGFKLFLHIFYISLYAFCTIILIISLFSSVKIQWKEGEWSLIDGPGNLSVIQYSDYFLKFSPSSLTTQYVSETYFKKIKSLLLKNEVFLILKILWLFILAGQILALFSRARHGRYFVPLIGICTAIIILLQYYFIIHPENWIKVDYYIPEDILANDPIFKLYSLIFNIIGIIIFIIFFLPNIYFLFSKNSRNYFSKFNIRPLLLGQEKRSEYETKQNISLKKPEVFMTWGRIFLHLVILISLSLLIGNLIYLPLFTVQIRNPYLTFIFVILVLAFLQAFYLSGYKSTLSTINGESGNALLVPNSKSSAYLFSFSYLCYKMFRNLFGVLMYIAAIIFFILLLLFIIFSNLNILELFDLLPSKKIF